MASNDSILEKLLKLAAKRFERDTSALGPDDDFFDRLDINSYQAMELLTEIEDEWSIEIPDYEVQDVRTFGALAQLIADRI
ncbi:MAG: acyl carrier protein [Sandaracinaceae bacterium]|nr:acyl carrier protein [Sandaracinaceae bacterium]MBK8409144.1 acyl carrier protein [Sandaracinaceae bacterium]